MATYSWEGRCFSPEYGNERLLNIYFVLTNHQQMIFVDTLQNKLGSKILGIEKYGNFRHNSDDDQVDEEDNQEDNEFVHITFIIKQNDKNEILEEVNKYFDYV